MKIKNILNAILFSHNYFNMNCIKPPMKSSLIPIDPPKTSQNYKSADEFFSELTKTEKIHMDEIKRLHKELEESRKVIEEKNREITQKNEYIADLEKEVYAGQRLAYWK